MSNRKGKIFSAVETAIVGAHLKPKIKNSFVDWIDEQGTTAIAKLLKVHPRSVRHWRRGTILPRNEQIHAIHKATKGRVAYMDVVKHVTETRAKGARS